MDDRDTRSEAYASHLQGLSDAWWRRALPVQAPYRWNIRRLKLGRVLDVGCGPGRNLAHLGGAGVGVDHNHRFVQIARSRGLTAYHTSEFRNSADARAGSFDTLLLAHVVEHMEKDAADSLIAEYLPYVRSEGRLVLVTPQEAGFRSDPSHVRFVDFSALADHVATAGCRVHEERSFPFPRWLGKFFAYNEFITIAKTPRR